MGGDDEREQTLNQLLVEMDGFDSKGGIIMIAAPIALTSWTPPSSGPDVSPGKSWWTARTCRGGRRSLKYTLEVHARGKLLGDDVNIETIARGTPVLMSPGESLRGPSRKGAYGRGDGGWPCSRGVVRASAQRGARSLRLPKGSSARLFIGKLVKEEDMSEKDMSAFASKILLATDGSPEAERATRMAVTLSNRLGSQLHVVRVGDVPSAYTYSEAEIFGREFQILRVHAEEYARERLDEEAEKVRAMGGEVAGSHAGAGSADAEIVRLAEELGVGLVIVGSRGSGALRRAVMGSVSSSVVRHAHGSVLVVRGDRREEDHLPGRILLALDGSKEANAAAQAAVEISNATGSELHIIYAVNTEPRMPWMPYLGPGTSDWWEEALREIRRTSRAWVDQQAERIESEGAKVADVHLVFGKPDEVIVKVGEELEAGLIVTGSRGLGGVRRALMGSVSDSVVRHAHCPVLVVRVDEEHTQNLAKAGAPAYSREYLEDMPEIRDRVWTEASSSPARKGTP
jgi:nucleotide-binding universal stress UspA family protein